MTKFGIPMRIICIIMSHFMSDQLYRLDKWPVHAQGLKLLSLVARCGGSVSPGQAAPLFSGEPRSR